MTKKIAVIDLDDTVIPKGLYCYTPTGETRKVDYVWDGEKKVKVKPYTMPKFKYCPYFSNKGDEAFCIYLNSSEGLLFDSVKECGVNDD